MSLASPAYVTGKVNNTAEAFRMALQSLLAGTGVVSGMAVSNVASALEIEISPGELFIPGTYGTEAAARANAGSQHATYSTMKANFTTQGTYHTWLATAYKLSVASNSSGKERIDLVVAKVEDGEYSGSLNQTVLAIVTGTPEASPKAPTPPEACVVLAEYKVPSGATKIETGNITDVRPRIPRLSWGAVSETGTILASTGDFTVEKVATGEYKVKWTNAKSSASYAVLAQGFTSASGSMAEYTPNVPTTGASAKSTASFYIEFWKNFETKASPSGGFSFIAAAAS